MQEYHYNPWLTLWADLLNLLYKASVRILYELKICETSNNDSFYKRIFALPCSYSCRVKYATIFLLYHFSSFFSRFKCTVHLDTKCLPRITERSEKFMRKKLSKNHWTCKSNASVSLRSTRLDRWDRNYWFWEADNHNIWGLFLPTSVQVLWPVSNKCSLGAVLDWL